ncbi:MAG: hypothetical protein IJ234_02435 [Clostridia bacterium]|nr:hypothetical protein [Clostridia bacterium]
MPLFRREAPMPSFNPQTHTVAVRKSICTAEETLGLVENATGRFMDLKKLESDEELRRFCKQAGVAMESVKVIY